MCTTCSWSCVKCVVLATSLAPKSTIFLLWHNRPTLAYATSVLRFLDHAHLDTHQVGLLSMSDQLIAEAITDTTYNKYKR